MSGSNPLKSSKTWGVSNGELSSKHNKVVGCGLINFVCFSTVYDIDMDKALVNKESLKDKSKKRKALTLVKKDFEARYKSGKNKWLFTKLRFWLFRW